MKKRLFPALIILMLFTSCELLLAPTTVSKDTILSNIKVCDNSYVGFLGFFHFEGKAENYNSFTVNQVELKATLYNKETKQKSIQNITVCVPITSYGLATYHEKFYVGNKVCVERVIAVSAQRY